MAYTQFIGASFRRIPAGAWYFLLEANYEVEEVGDARPKFGAAASRDGGPGPALTVDDLLVGAAETGMPTDHWVILTVLPESNILAGDVVTFSYSGGGPPFCTDCLRQKGTAVPVVSATDMPAVNWIPPALQSAEAAAADDVTLLYDVPLEISQAEEKLALTVNEVSRDFTCSIAEGTEDKGMRLTPDDGLYWLDTIVVDYQPAGDPDHGVFKKCVLDYGYGEDHLFGIGDIEIPALTDQEVANNLVPGGHEIFIKAGTPPVPGVDAPVKQVDREFNQATLSEVDLNLLPDTTHYLGVWAVNPSGRAEQGAGFSFPTDADGHPLQVPTPVSGLSAKPRPGGSAIVRWRYEENNPLAIADWFQLRFDPLSGQSSGPTFQYVTHIPPKRDYHQPWTQPPGAGDGAWRASVLSVKGGKYVADVTGVEFIADSTPPVEAIAGLTAE